MLKPGVITLTANQAGNGHYSAATPVTQQVSFTEYLEVLLPPISNRSLCSADFNANGIAADNSFPMRYTSSNPSVAKVDNNGIIHITGTGTTTITLYQDGQLPLYVSADPKSETFTVTAPVTPALSIAAASSSSCLGTPVTFTATPQNGGNAPDYQWKVNGVNAGSNSIKFTTSTLANGDEVSCIITNTDNTCISAYTATAKTTILRTTPSTPAVHITASSNEIITGTSITFIAAVTNAVGPVNYQWLVNGIPANSNNQTFTSSTLSNNDVVTCAISQAAACSIPAVGNQIQISVVTQVNIPNTFTPNGDGINDKWDISGIGSYPNCLVNIYNRYGKLLYHSRGYDFAWDGTISGSAVPVATYYYVIALGMQNRIMSGYVTILR